MLRWHCPVSMLAQKPQALIPRANISFHWPCVGLCYPGLLSQWRLTQRAWEVDLPLQKDLSILRGVKAAQTRSSKSEKNGRMGYCPQRGKNARSDVGIPRKARQSPNVRWVVSTGLAGAVYVQAWQFPSGMGQRGPILKHDTDLGDGE